MGNIAQCPRLLQNISPVCDYKCRYDVGRYISLERIIEVSKSDYYRTLGASSISWHSSKHDLFPWWSYFLSHVKSGYQELKDRVELQSGDSKTALIRGLVFEMTEQFSISDIMKLQPNLDREIVKKALSQLKKEKIVFPISPCEFDKAFMGFCCISGYRCEISKFGTRNSDFIMLPMNRILRLLLQKSARSILILMSCQKKIYCLPFSI